jgi:hypothetical protein
MREDPRVQARASSAEIMPTLRGPPGVCSARGRHRIHGLAVVAPGDHYGLPAHGTPHKRHFAAHAVRLRGLTWPAACPLSTCTRVDEQGRSQCGRTLMSEPRHRRLIAIGSRLPAQGKARLHACSDHGEFTAEAVAAARDLTVSPQVAGVFVGNAYAFTGRQAFRVTAQPGRVIRDQLASVQLKPMSHAAGRTKRTPPCLRAMRTTPARLRREDSELQSSSSHEDVCRWAKECSPASVSQARQARLQTRLEAWRISPEVQYWRIAQAKRL